MWLRAGGLDVWWRSNIAPRLCVAGSGLRSAGLSSNRHVAKDADVLLWISCLMCMFIVSGRSKLFLHSPEVHNTDVVISVGLELL